MTGIEMPTSLSRFYKRMGKLTNVLVSFEINDNGEGENSTISVNQDISRTLKRHKEDISRTIEKDIRKPSNPNSKKVISDYQLRVSETTKRSNKVEGIKESSFPPSNRFIKEDSKRVELDKGTRRIQEQSIDEWFADYEDNQFSGASNFK
jgi:hypothetical protein